MSVFAYDDYRAFLRDRYLVLRKENRRFSHRFIGSRIGYSSSGWFSDLLKGRMNLPGTQRTRLANVFHLCERESEYFAWLVEHNQAASLEERNRCLRKMLEFKEIQADLVGLEKFTYYSKWYFPAVREMLFFFVFKGDYPALARRLKPAITASQAKEAIQVLLKLDFIHKAADGTLRPRPITLKKDSSSKSPRSGDYLIEYIRLGMEAFDRFEAGERHVSGMTLSFSEHGFRKATAEIERLRKKLLALMKDDPKPDAVYQINMQCFPLSRRDGK